jgi:hypothetical protein
MKEHAARAGQTMPIFKRALKGTLAIGDSSSKLCRSASTGAYPLANGSADGRRE